METSRLKRRSFNRYGNHPDEDFSNYGRGGYYGNTYDQQGSLEDKDNSSRGTPDNYRSLGDRRWDDNGRGGWWEEEEPLRKPGYRPDKERFEGTHKGKGPRAYQRPDERIREDINDRLYADPYLDASGIEVNVNDSEIVLTGIVESRQAKRRAEDLGETVSGVKNVINKLRIRQKGRQPENLTELLAAQKEELVRPIPPGFHTVTPFLIADNALKLIEFIKKAFNGQVTHMTKSSDEVVKHATLRIGDSMVMISSATALYQPMPCMLHLYVTDVDAVYQKALTAGGISLREPTNAFHGDRSAGIKDKWNNQWWIATHIEDVSDEEIKAREEKLHRE